MYRVLLVDDERPALNYLNTIVQKYMPDFEVSGMMEDGQSAYTFLGTHPVDVLVTDISMPGGMNGIDLAQKARKAFPALHIVIVSGYTEFEYAHGALQAGVEDYLLKPVSVTKAKEVMAKVKESLDEERLTLRQQLLSNLLLRKEVPVKTIQSAFGASPFYFAVVRFGNLNDNRRSRLSVLLPGPLNRPGWFCYTGHDENEWILLRPVTQRFGRFSVELQEILTQYPSQMPWTAIHEISPKPLQALPVFLEQAFKRMNEQLIIGASQLLSITSEVPKQNTAISTTIRRQLSAHMMSSSWSAIKELFLSLAAEWENARLPQAQVEQLCSQLIDQVVSENDSTGKSQADIRQTSRQLFSYTGSLGELLAGLYGELFGDLSIHDKKLSGEELCDYTLSYIRENYALPLSIQSVCAKIGFSQTYLSRLLRKYADTSVNAYLTQCRIDAAKKMLKSNPSILLRDVATAVGYEDQSYFNKIFRHETGMTPKQYAAQFDKEPS